MLTKEEEAKLLAEQKAKEEADAKAEAESKAKDDDEEDKEKSKSDEASKLEEQLQKEREAREKAEKVLADKAFKDREKKRLELEAKGEEEELSEDDKPITRREFQELLKRERKNEAEEIVAGMTDNVKERELILLTFKNRSYPSHLSLKEQLNEAYVVANLPRIQGENQELKRALSGKKNANTDSSQNHQDSPQTLQPKLAPADSAELARQGWKWNGVSKRHEKKMPKGTLVRHKDGRTEFLNV